MGCIRPEVMNFAEDMENKLKANDTRKSGWEDLGFAALLRKLKEEVQELEDAFVYGNTNDVSEECADVANYAMMISNKLKKHR